jgi:hypothetical protein
MTRTTRLDHDALDRLLVPQLDVVTRQQAIAAGASDNALRHRLRRGGPWRSLVPGVYLAATGAPTTLQQEMAALLYAGPGSVITGPAALRHHHIRGELTDVVDVLVPAARKRRDAAFIRLHRTARLPGRTWEAGPVRYVPPPRAVADAVRGLASLRDVRAIAADAVQWVKSQLPMPLFNASLYDYHGTFIAWPDAWWPRYGIAVEVDSREWHMSPEDHAKTLTRGRRMAKYQIVVLRFTPRQIRAEPAQVVKDIKDALNGARGRQPLNLRAVPAAGPRQPDEGAA